MCLTVQLFYNKINEDARRGGIDVKAEDIIDIIDGYKGAGCGVSTRHKPGGYTCYRTEVIEVFERGIQLCINC